jgi:arginine utilization protein RocB
MPTPTDIRATRCRRRCYVRGVSLRDLSGRFRDEVQRQRVQLVIHDRFADDRNQDECRYIMRFWWQLSMSYTEVTAEQLMQHVNEPKLTALEELIDAIRSSAEAIDAWAASAEAAFPIVFDRGVHSRLGL